MSLMVYGECFYMKKLQTLKKIIGGYKSAVIAFSGGADSTFLAFVAGEILPNNLLLVTVSSVLYPSFALEEAQKVASLMTVKHRIIRLTELDMIDVPQILHYLPDRCYYCKRKLFTEVKKCALNEGYEGVFDGSNADDLKDYRPGRKALEELSIGSPLCKAGLTKAEIRYFSNKVGLPTAQKPATPCLATRFPYGEKLTNYKLKRVAQAENALRTMGFIQFRIRSHRDMARIEFSQKEIETGWAKRKLIQTVCKRAGFMYVAIDTEGYRKGAMDEALPKFS